MGQIICRQTLLEWPEAKGRLSFICHSALQKKGTAAVATQQSIATTSLLVCWRPHYQHPEMNPLLTHHWKSRMPILSHKSLEPVHL